MTETSPTVQTPADTGFRKPRRLLVHVGYDDDTESPSDREAGWGFRLISFGRRHVNHEDPSKFFGDNGRPVLWLRNKLKAKTAFFLSYYEHGLCRWPLSGEGPHCQWDSVDVAGLLLWEGKAKDLHPLPQPRVAAARAFLEEYTDWCNGECYWYSIEDADTGEEVDSCGGFIGWDAVREAITEYTEGELVRFVGDLAHDLEPYQVKADPWPDEDDDYE